MKTGKILNGFTAKDGREVILRAPIWEDLEDIVELNNSLVDEGADTFTDRKVTREKKADWMGELLRTLTSKIEVSFELAEARWFNLNEIQKIKKIDSGLKQFLINGLKSNSFRSEN